MGAKTCSAQRWVKKVSTMNKEYGGLSAEFLRMYILQLTGSMSMSHLDLEAYTGQICLKDKIVAGE